MAGPRSQRPLASRSRSAGRGVDAAPPMAPRTATRWLGRWASGLRAMRGCRMKIRVGYELIYDFPQPTPMIMVLGTHFTRASDIVVPDHLMTSPSVPISSYRDIFGNWCSRIVAPVGRIRLWADGVVNDTGRPDSAAPWAAQHAIEDLPAETLNF